MTRLLALRKETLTDLTPADLAAVHGGGYTPDTYLTQICIPLTLAIVHAVTEVPAALTVTCA